MIDISIGGGMAIIYGCATAYMGSPQSQLCGERTSSEMNELSDLSGSE